MRTRNTVIAFATVLVVALIMRFFYLPNTDGGGTRSASPDDAAHTSKTPRPPTDSRPSSATIRPRPFSETEPVEGSDSRAGALEIEVIGSAGKPASKARLVLHREKDVLGKGTTNGDGLVRLNAGDGEAELIIVPDGAPVHRAAISMTAGRRRIQLPSGVSIRGRVQVNDAPPGEPVTLHVRGSDDPVAEEIGHALNDEPTATCTTTSSGEFELAGTRPGSEWRFSDSLRHRIDEVRLNGKEVFVVAAPASSVLVLVSRLVIVRGRVVSADGNVPLARATCEVEWIGPKFSDNRELQTGDDGTFRFSAGVEHDRTGEVRAIQISAWGPDGISSKALVLEPPPAEDQDVGDLVILSGRTIDFVVKDPTGAPIEGALARVGSVRRSSRTDAQGHGAITLNADEPSFFVGGLKHEVVEVPIPEKLEEPLAVTLNPTCGLEVSVVSNPPPSPNALHVRISADASEAYDQYGPNDPIQVEAGAAGDGFREWKDGVVLLHYVPDAKGRVVVAGLKTGVPITVAVVDALGVEHASTGVTLGPAEWKSLELRVTKGDRSLRGRILDPFGQPVGDARVTISPDPDDADAKGWSGTRPREIEATSDALGRFVLTGIFASVVNLETYKAGFAPLVRRQLALPQDGTEIGLTFQKGCTLTVSITAADGVPIRDLRVDGNVPGYPDFFAEEKEPGVYGLADLPLGVTATVKTQWADREWTRSVLLKGDAVERMTMPATGKVVIEYPHAEDLCTFILQLATADNQHVINNIFYSHDPDSGDANEYELARVVPGEYTATLKAYVPGKDGEVEVAAPQRLIVRAGQTTRVVLRKP